AHACMLNSGFLSVLVLCHVVLTFIDPASGRNEYRVQSPDGATDMGYAFLECNKVMLSMRSLGSDEPKRYGLLNILEFNTARKSMSIVLKKLEGNDDHI
ncbi:hypothetical protein EDD85DRAFT_740548, partial [Armillaria nabsnona]